MRYLPTTDEQVSAMLETIGAADLDTLFEPVPDRLRFRGEMDLPSPLAEEPLVRHMRQLAARNTPMCDSACFLGGGVYDHYAPAMVDQVLLRSEFYTAYTPYQPEVSQGTLQAIFEFQTMVCQLTEMDVANASLYDGASAVAEAVLLVDRLQPGRASDKGPTRVLISQGINPEIMEVLCTYLRYREDIVLEPVVLGPDGRTDLDALGSAVTGAAAVVLSYPNYLGCVEDLQAVSEIAGAAKAKLVVTVPDPLALGALRGPGAFGADIVCSEGQPLGIPPSFGGPGVGLFAAKKAYMRKMPGRLCGETVDLDGKRGYVLTLSTREQHIRREKATSNICTNQGLMALAATVYMALMGKQGVAEVARQSHLKAAYLHKRIGALDGFSLPFDAPFFHEFVVQFDGDARTLLGRLTDRGFLAGIPLNDVPGGGDGRFLVCATERNTRESIDAMVQAMDELGRELR